MLKIAFVVLPIATNQWEEPRTANETVNAVSKAERVEKKPSTYSDEAKARSEEMFANVRADIARKEPRRSALDKVKDRYGELIEQYGRNQAGAMIKKEQDAAFKAKDFKRVEC